MNLDVMALPGLGAIHRAEPRIGGGGFAVPDLPVFGACRIETGFNDRLREIFRDVGQSLPRLRLRDGGMIEIDGNRGKQNRFHDGIGTPGRQGTGSAGCRDLAWGRRMCPGRIAGKEGGGGALISFEPGLRGGRRRAGAFGSRLPPGGRRSRAAGNGRGTQGRPTGGPVGNARRVATDRGLTVGRTWSGRGRSGIDPRDPSSAWRRRNGSHDDDGSGDEKPGAGQIRKDSLHETKELSESREKAGAGGDRRHLPGIPSGGNQSGATGPPSPPVRSTFSSEVLSPMSGVRTLSIAFFKSVAKLVSARVASAAR